MPRQIELYEEMGRLSSCMVAAARSGDWEELVTLEDRVARLRALLGPLSAEPGLPDDDLARRRQLIERILDDDAEIRRHTEPWMEQLRHLLGDHHRLRELQRAYAVATGRSPAA